MIALFALAAVASATPPAPLSTGPVVQARATVRIVSGVRLKLDGSANGDAPPPRETIIVAGGQPHPASLIEFQ
jgi:hypothetical protein